MVHNIKGCKGRMRDERLEDLRLALKEIYPFKDEPQTALFKDPVRTAL
jgi:hypothetical protein